MAHPTAKPWHPSEKPPTTWTRLASGRFSRWTRPSSSRSTTSPPGYDTVLVNRHHSTRDL